MRILLLSDANSIHTVRWVKGLSLLGLSIGLWSINKPNSGLYDGLENVKIYYSDLNQSRFGIIAKLKYLTLFFSLKKAIKDFEPDLIHAHYASSFGLLGALSGFKPFLLSVWGSDVFEFPNFNFLFKKVLKYNFKKADFLMSTSHAMADEASKYTKKKFAITPFGIDLDFFKPNGLVKQSSFTIGTIKTLEEKYGIDQLIDAFYIFRNKYPKESLKLMIVGEGSRKSFLERKVKKLGIGEFCEFKGKIEYSMVPFFHQQLDICICLSNSESFGVSAIEASSVETPLVVSNVGGLPEVVEQGVTGIVVPAKDPQSAADAIEKLYLDKALRENMGREGRKRVEKLYDWNKNLADMVNIYRTVLRQNER
ncbi:glycosyltransferase family 4 protein [Echinicola soli]|uniref:Glycosyltransferase family 4 protein n=1 Tax=Echinicola soli TaxID=2591634 RepID=A0A514CN37_9BACT|nr:glycosyltransferase [Echinicola soli]QDH81242.1 glycosyltransferase family 4 protein [Echinicola soli]